MVPSMTEPLFDANIIAARLSRSGRVWRVQDHLAERLLGRLQAVKKPLEKVLDLSLDGGGMAGLMRAGGREVVALDWRTGEDVGWPEGQVFDAAVSHLRLPVVNDVPAFLYRAMQRLVPDGLLLATTLGTESFKELRAAFAQAGLSHGGRVIPLTDVQAVGELLQRLKLALPVVDRDVVTLTFTDFDALLAQLTAHGARNISPFRQKGLMTPRQLLRVKEAYERLFKRDDGRLPLTLEVIYLHGWTPGEGQPAAAKRGSGKVSLVRILGETR